MRYLEIKENYYIIYSSNWRTKKKNKEKHDYLMIHSTNSLHNIMLTNSTTQKYRFMKQSMLLKFTACGAEQRTSKLGSSGAGWSIFELFGQKDKSTNREPGAQNRWKRKKWINERTFVLWICLHRTEEEEWPEKNTKRRKNTLNTGGWEVGRWHRLWSLCSTNRKRVMCR